MANHSDYLDQAYIRGKLTPFEDANVPVATNALQYGGAIFGGVKGYLQKDGSIKALRLDDHIQRLLNSAKILRFPFKLDEKQIRKIFEEVTAANAPSKNTYYRPFIYRSDINLSPAIEGEYDFALYMMSLGDYFDKSKGLDVCISSWTRNSDNAIPPRTKVSGGYVNSSLAMHDAQANGFDAAIMLDSSGHVSEGAVMNLFIVRDGKIVTPPASADILEGITRRTVLEVAKDNGFEVEERQIDRSELYIAEEVFFSGTATELSLVSSIDKVKISDTPGPILSKLQGSFDEIIKGEYKKRSYLETV